MLTMTQRIHAACNPAPAIITVAYCDAKIASASRTVENGASRVMVERGLQNILLWTARKSAIIASGI